MILERTPTARETTQNVRESFPRTLYEKRWERVRELLERHNLEGVWFFSYENRRYLSGFTGSNAQVFLTRHHLLLLTDGRYANQAREEAVYDDLLVYHLLEKPFAELSRGLRIGFEGCGLNYADAKRLLSIAGISDAVDLSSELKNLRIAKDNEEIRCIRRAIAIAERTFQAGLGRGRIRTQGKSEEEVALRLELNLRRRGSGPLPFPIIAASGERSALPHGVASGRIIKEGDPLTLDFGAEWQGYFSDMTFSGSVATKLPWLEEIVVILQGAQEEAFKVIAPGVPAKEVDARARAVITAAGFGEYFPHSLGHGVGLLIHEPPSLNAHSEEILEAGMVLTVEPGIYIPGKGGARIEDMVLVTKDGFEVLTRISKEYRIFL